MKVKLDVICRVIGAEFPKNTGNLDIQGVASLEDAGPHDISFLSNQKYAKYLDTTGARVIIVSEDIALPHPFIPLAVKDPYFSFMTILGLFNTRMPEAIASGIHRDAYIDPSAEIGNNVSIGPGAVIGPETAVGENTVIGPCTVVMEGSLIGSDCIIYPNVSIMDGCTVGNRVILHAGVVIGADGFGFAPHGGKYHKIPQIGTVRIGDDVEIGANACIDRAAFGETVVGNGSKIDNLVQVAHNVRIGAHTVIASQVGISGSTVIGDWVRLGGQAGLAGHIMIGDGASAGAQAGVTKDIPPGETVSGYPAKNHMHAMRLEAALRSLPDLIKKVKAQEKRILELEQKIKERS